MKMMLTILIGVGFLSSCIKEEIVPQQPIDPQPIVTNPTIEDSVVSFKGETWVVTKVMNTDMIYEDRSDTLVFIGVDNYKFNGYKSKYNLDVTPTNYKLTLYDTPWGNIGGSLLNYNIVSGMVEGLYFFDIFDTNQKVKLWMKKI